MGARDDVFYFGGKLFDGWRHFDVLVGRGGLGGLSETYRGLHGSQCTRIHLRQLIYHRPATGTRDSRPRFIPLLHDPRQRPRRRILPVQRICQLLPCILVRPLDL